MEVRRAGPPANGTPHGNGTTANSTYGQAGTSAPAVEEEERILEGREVSKYRVQKSRARNRSAQKAPDRSPVRGISRELGALATVALLLASLVAIRLFLCLAGRGLHKTAGRGILSDVTPRRLAGGTEPLVETSADILGEAGRCFVNMGFDDDEQNGPSDPLPPLSPSPSGDTGTRTRQHKEEVGTEAPATKLVSPNAQLQFREAVLVAVVYSCIMVVAAFMGVALVLSEKHVEASLFAVTAAVVTPLAYAYVVRHTRRTTPAFSSVQQV